MTRVRLAALVVAGLLLAIVASPAAAQDFGKTPVFFVHGHGESSSAWTSFMNTLVAAGYPRELLRAIDLVPDGGPNREAAEQQMAPAIETFLADVNALLDAQGYTGARKSKVDLVSHSMGGLSTRWYAAVVAPERVGSWISLAGANHGTDALCPAVGYDAGGAAEVCPAYSTDAEDVVQLTLNGTPDADVDETPWGIGADAPGVSVVPPDATRRIFYATIRTDNDAWIVPAESVLVDGSGGRVVTLPEGFPAVETSPGAFLMTNGVTHDMTGDWQAQQLVIMLLDAAEAPAPVEGTATTGRMRGRGRLDGAGQRFAFRIALSPGAAPAGRLEYRDTAGRFVATALTAAAFSDDDASVPVRRARSVTFTGVGAWNGAPGHAFQAQAIAGGEPGNDADAFALTVTAPDGTVVVTAAGGVARGDVQWLSEPRP